MYTNKNKLPNMSTATSCLLLLLLLSTPYKKETNKCKESKVVNNETVGCTYKLIAKIK